MDWTREAEERLERVPPFLRSMVRGRAEALAREGGEARVTEQHLVELGKRRPGGAARDPRAIVWTDAARRRLDESPPFFRSELQRTAEEAARAGGHLEVNLALLERLEGEAEFERRLEWNRAAERRLDAGLAMLGGPIRVFASPAMEEAAERVARAAGRRTVEPGDVECAFDTATAGVEWSPEALSRVRNAPEFVRAGIKKAAEAAARREGLSRIEPEDLSRFRNRAMMRAVKRMRTLGYRELTFDAFDKARERVPRLRDNPQAERRFAAIRRYVEGGAPLGLIGAGLLDRMKRFLSDGSGEGA